MPNWSYNKTEIVFKKKVEQEEIQKFINKLIIKEKEDNELIINLEKVVPLQESEKYDRELAYDKWGSKWTPVVDKMDYNKENKILTLDYSSAWSPINQALETIYENNDNIIEYISTDFEEPNMRYYGKFYVDENGTDISEYELPNFTYIKEDDFKKLYDLIKYKNIDVELPDQIIEEIKDSENYINYLENLSILASMEFDKEDYDFSDIWDNYIYENEIDYDLKELMKIKNKDLVEYISSILKKYTLKQNVNNDKNLT